MRARPVSESVYQEACRCMPGGVSSPVRAFRALGIPPLVVEKGKGDLLFDVDGHAYIDWCQSFGALILGHAPEPVVQCLLQRLVQGSSFGLVTPFEKELATKIQSHLPHLEKLRFVCSGTEAVMTAIRLSRAYTGKSLIIKFNGHYHGHSDSLLIQAGSGVTSLPQASSRGIPDALVQSTLSLPFNEIDLCRAILRSREDIAAIILEPVAANMGVVPATPAFLEMLREESARRGIVLIFDEVVTGFRLGLTGASGLYGITPDLTCLGKVIGGGLPAAALGGSGKIMDQIAPLGDVYQAGTLSGNPLAMCAGLETLKAIEAPHFFTLLSQTMDRFLDPIRSFIRIQDLPVTVQSVGSMFTIFFGVKQVQTSEDITAIDTKMFAHFFQFLFERGIYLSPSPYEAHFLSSAHTEESVHATQMHILEFLKCITTCAQSQIQ